MAGKHCGARIGEDIDCRTLIATLAAAPFAGAAAPDRLHAAIVAEERQAGGRIGIAILDSATGRCFAYRADERFPMCRRFKFPLAAAILERVDVGHEQLDAAVPLARDDILENSRFAQPASVRKPRSRTLQRGGRAQRRSDNQLAILQRPDPAAGEQATSTGSNRPLAETNAVHTRIAAGIAEAYG